MKQADRLIVNVLSNYGVMAIEIVASLVALPIVVGHLTREGFGLASMVLTVLGVFELIAVSLSRTLQRFIPQALGTNDLCRMNRVFSVVYAGFLLLGVSGAVVTWVLRDWLLEGAKVSPEMMADGRVAFWLLLGWLAVGFPAGIYIRVVEALQRYDLVAVYTTIATVVRSVGLITVFLCGYGSITVFVVAQLLTQAIILFGCRRVLGDQVPNLRASPKLIARQEALELSRFTGGILLFVFGNLCITQGYRVFVGKELGFGDLGALAAVFTITNLMWRLIYSMLSTLTPAVSAMQSAGRIDNVQRIFVTGAKYALAVSISFCVVPLPVIASVFGLWLGDEFKGLDSLLFVAMLSQILVTLGTTPQLILMGLGRVHVSGVITLLRGILSLAAAWLFVVLISRSLAGSLACLFLVQAVGGYILFLYTCNSVELSKWQATIDVTFWPSLLGVLGAGVTWLVAGQVGSSRWWSVMLSAGCGELVFGVLLLAFGLSVSERERMADFMGTLRSKLLSSGEKPASV